LRSDTGSFRYSTWFIQSDYVIVQPLQASLRYESVAPPDATGVKALKAVNVSLSYFAYANVKTMLEYRRDLGESKNYMVNAILLFAF